MQSSEQYRDDWVKVRELQTKILQEYIQLRITNRSSNSNWKDEYQNLLATGSNPPANAGRRAKRLMGHFTHMKKQFESIGAKNFTFSSFDTTDACWFVLHCLSDFSGVGKIDPDVNRFIRCIREDRNALDPHTRFNESGFSIMWRTLVSIDHLKRFISAVKDEGTNSINYGANWQSYCNKWATKISDFENGIEQRYESFERNRIEQEDIIRDIKSICSQQGPNQMKAYSITLEKYRIKHNTVEEHMRLFTFQKELADSGVDIPCRAIADYYFSGAEVLGIARDYEQAARYYSRALAHTNGRLSVLSKKEELHIIDLMIAGLIQDHDRVEGERLLADYSSRLRDGAKLDSKVIDGLTIHSVKDDINIPKAIHYDPSTGKVTKLQNGGQ